MGKRGSGLLLLPILLAACGGPVQTRVSSTGPGVVEPKTIMRDEIAPTGPARAARDAVTAMLAKRGFAEAADGELQLQVALSERDAALAVSAVTPSGKRNIAPAKQKKPLQSCLDREYRISVVLTRISDGAMVYKGDAAEYHCKAKLAEVMPSLAERALADLAKPKGEYVVSRSGVE
jgi:hypothetical protein